MVCKVYVASEKKRVSETHSMCSHNLSIVHHKSSFSDVSKFTNPYFKVLTVQGL